MILWRPMYNMGFPVALCFLACCAFGEDQRPYLERHQCTIHQKKQIAIVENQVAKADIILPEQCSKSVDFAAKELKAYLDKATGADVKIIRSESYRRLPQPVRTRTSIFLGESPWTEGMTGIRFAALPRDSFVIKEVNGAIIIAGHDDPYFDTEKEISDRNGYWHRYEHATLLGVYDFLERFVGIRFYFPVEELVFIPKTPTLTIPFMDIEESPDFTVRCAYWEPSQQFENQGYWKNKAELWRVRTMQTLYSRGETIKVPNCHGLQTLGLLERFGATHPEFFALNKDGKRAMDIISPGDGSRENHLCYSSKELEDEVFKDAKSYLCAESPTVRNIRSSNRWENACRWSEAATYPGYFNIMPMDGFRKCYCGECRKYIDAGNGSDLVFGFAGRIAQRLKDEGIKGTITIMSYDQFYRQPPKMSLPDNVKVMVAELGPWAEQNLTPEERKAPGKLIHAWREKLHGNRVSLWNYLIGVSISGTAPKGIPPFSPRNIAAYYKRNAPDIDGAFAELDLWNILHHYLNMYVYSKVSWDSSLDVEKLLSEHHKTLFGPAAKPMESFYNTMEETWVSKGLPRIEFGPLEPIPVNKSQYEMWEQIYNERLIEELSGYLDKAKYLAGTDITIAKRVKFIRDNFLAPIVDERNKYLSLTRQVSALVLDVPIVQDGSDGISLDGKLDEPIWAKASAAYMTPALRKRPPVATKILAFYKNQNLYLGIECEEDKTDDLVLNGKNKDGNLWGDSCVEVVLKPSLERTNSDYLHFMFNANGDVATEKVGLPGQGDWKWNCGVKAKASIDKGKRFTLEAVLPLDRILGHSVSEGECILANFTRVRFLKNEKVDVPLSVYYSWSPFLRYNAGGFHDLENFGTLRFTRGAEKVKEMVENGGFEGKSSSRVYGTIPESWGAWYVTPGNAPPVIEVDSSTSREGIHSLKIQNKGIVRPTTEEEGIKITVDHVLPEHLLKPNTEYLLTYSIKTEGIKVVCGGSQQGAFIYLCVTDNEPNVIPAVGYSGDIPWSRQGFKFRTSSSIGFKDPKLKPHLWLCLWNATGTVWFDDIRLQETSKR